MTGILNELHDLLFEQIDRHKNLPLLKAAMASCALAAASTEKVRLCQRVRVDQILETFDKLKVFDAHEGVELFNQFVEKIRTDWDSGHSEALKAVKAVAKNKETATMLAQFCLLVSQSNGSISPTERLEIENLCQLLEIQPEKLGLDCAQSNEPSIET